MKELFKIWILAFSVVCLIACTPSYTDETGTYTKLPEELKDCKIYSITDGTSYLTVIRCPNSQTSTTYRSGKTKRTAVVID